jgi:hypothetical protein
MSKTPRRVLDEVQAALADLAHRVVVDPGSSLDLDLRDRLLDITDELELFIPGLDAPADPSAARQLTAAAAAALAHGRPRIALARSLRGLSYSPHHAELFYLASSACFELGATTEAVRLLAHTLWVNPGHARARSEMEALSACDDRDAWWSPDEAPGEDSGGERAA